MSDDTKSGASDSPATLETENAGAGKSLAERLAEFETATQGKSTSSKDESPTELAALRTEVDRLRGIEADRSYRKEMDSMIPSVNGELNVHPRLVEAWLNDQSESDPKLRQVWENRDQDRGAFEQAVSDLKPKFEAYVEKEGLKGTAKSTDDSQKQLQAAVRIARGTQPGNMDLSTVELEGMNDHDFALHKQEVFRLSSAGQLQ